MAEQEVHLSCWIPESAHEWEHARQTNWRHIEISLKNPHLGRSENCLSLLSVFQLLMFDVASAYKTSENTTVGKVEHVPLGILWGFMLKGEVIFPTTAQHYNTQLYLFIFFRPIYSKGGELGVCSLCPSGSPPCSNTLMQSFPDKKDNTVGTTYNKTALDCWLVVQVQ